DLHIEDRVPGTAAPDGRHGRNGGGHGLSPSFPVSGGKSRTALRRTKATFGNRAHLFWLDHRRAAAIHIDRGAGDVGAGVGDEEAREIGELLGLAEAAERDV